MNFDSVVKQIFGKLKLIGGTDGTPIGNVGDALKIAGTIMTAAPEGLADTGNSSTTPLGADATFTGAAIDIKDYSAINVAAFSDVSSATDGLKMQFSPDGTNWDHQHTFSVTGGVGVSYAQSSELRYFRIVYVNGATPQTFFRLTSVLKASNVSPSRYTVAQTLTGGQMADVTKSIIWGLSSSGGGTYVPTKVTPSGSLTTAIGDITGVVGQNTMANSLPVTIASNQTAVPASQSGTWNITDISGTVSLPTGAATSAKQDSQITELQAIKGYVDAVETKLDTLITQTDGLEGSLSSIDTKVATAAKQPSLGTAGTPSSDVITVQGASGMTALKVDGSAVTQPISGSVSVSNFPATQNVSVTSSVEVEVKNDAGNPIPVNGTVAATQSGTWNINNVSGTVTLPTGASTLAAQNTGNTSLSSIDTKTPPLGQTTSTGSTPVVIASDQSAVTVTDQQLATYGAGVTNLVAAATATDIITITGSATRVVRIRKIHISGTATTGSIFDVFLVKRSSADTGGTSTTPTVVPFDSANAAGTAVVRAYTANPTTLGTSVGTISQSMLYFSPTTNSNNNFVQPGNVIEIDFDGSGMQALVLRGVNEQLCINLNGATITGSNIECDIVWTESAT